MSLRPTVLALALLTATALPAAAKDQKPLFKSGTVDASGVYNLSPDELALDCRKLAGSIQIRIMQLRTADSAPKTSEIGRQAQATVAPIVGASSRGADPDADKRADRAVLEAYNRQLAAKGCRTYDLVKELDAKTGSALPSNSPKSAIVAPPPPKR
jgi:hypothetical protein